MAKPWMCLLACLLSLVLMPASAALAQSATTQPSLTQEQQRLCGLCDAKQKMRESLPWWTWNFDMRLREVVTPNLTLNKEDRHFQRYRFRIASSVTPVENLSFNFRIMYEPRHYCQPDSYDNWTMNESFFDTANVEWKKAFGLPLTIKAGRQDINFGNGWLVFDGTPTDGSRTLFFDAIRGTYDAQEIKTVFDAIYLDNHANSSYYLPVFCDKDFDLIESDEKGVILYASNKSLEKTQLDGYFMYKNEEKVTSKGHDSDIYLVGARAAGDLSDNWKYRGEFAQEMGHRDGRTLCAFGFNSQLSYNFNDTLKDELHTGYEFLSGDRSSTGKDDQFDPMWGRWPQWSELYIYPAGLDERSSELTNHHRVNFGWSCVPAKDMSLAANYNILFAATNSATGANFSDDGSLKGHSVSSVWKWKLDEHWATHVYAEVFFPGNYYSDLRNEVAGFFRWEVTFTW